MHCILGYTSQMEAGICGSLWLISKDGLSFFLPVNLLTVACHSRHQVLSLLSPLRGKPETLLKAKHIFTSSGQLSYLMLALLLIFWSSQWLFYSSNTFIVVWVLESSGTQLLIKHLASVTAVSYFFRFWINFYWRIKTNKIQLLSNPRNKRRKHWRNKQETGL